jgi:hypothetical protein
MKIIPLTQISMAIFLVASYAITGPLWSRLGRGLKKREYVIRGSRDGDCTIAADGIVLTWCIIIVATLLSIC